jgi:hypothetical protein
MLLRISSEKRPIELHVYSKVHYKGKYQTKKKKNTIEQASTSARKAARPSPEVAADERHVMAAWKLWKVLLLEKLITTTAKDNPLKTTIATDSSKTSKKDQNKAKNEVSPLRQYIVKTRRLHTQKIQGNKSNNIRYNNNKTKGKKQVKPTPAKNITGADE